MLKSQLFITENYEANSKRQSDVIVGVGYPPANLNSQWFFKVDMQSREGFPFDIPRGISPFGHYTMIGVNHGNLCLRVTEAGLNSRLMDKAWKHREYPVSIEAFGYLRDGLNYHILNVWRSSYGQGALSWPIYDSEVEDWSLARTYNTDVPKLGPQSVVSNVVVFWIGWDGVDYAVPKCIVSFNLRDMQFYHGQIPIEAPSEKNALTNFKGGVAFITYRDVGFSQEVVVRNMFRKGIDSFVWERMFTICDFRIPFTPSVLIHSSIIFVLECGASSGAENNTERTDVYVFILKHRKAEMDMFYHNYWEEDVQIKTITLHSDGLYSVRKDPTINV
ncbi:hypothetical protein PIB30_040108 [Stylosanthes scabra]|uniref:Uncharacterized protein n=1 Tax=Stylosanthes scabra TaxID=79078 RepID=A0ABU6RF32_9FABA|nr:hypothetical protein [Stylosanthes scabra]